jgi:hypothetical protein
VAMAGRWAQHTPRQSTIVRHTDRQRGNRSPLTGCRFVYFDGGRLDLSCTCKLFQSIVSCPDQTYKPLNLQTPIINVP